MMRKQRIVYQNVVGKFRLILVKSQQNNDFLHDFQIVNKVFQESKIGCLFLILYSCEFHLERVIFSSNKLGHQVLMRRLIKYYKIKILMSTQIKSEPKKTAPKPESLKKKEARDAKYNEALVKAREERRVANKARRADVLKRAQTHEANHQKWVRQQTDLRRKAKETGALYVPAESRLAFVIRIRGINKLNPKVVRILRLLRLRQLHNGVFVRVNKAAINMLRRVEPYITYGYPSRDTVRKLIYKRGYGKINGQRIPLTNNNLIERALGKKHNIVCIEDLINEINSVGTHFKEANNFLWPFKLTPPRGGFISKRHPIQRGGDWGNREELINDLILKML